MGKAKVWGKQEVPEELPITAQWLTPRGMQKRSTSKTEITSLQPELSSEEDVPECLKDIDYWKAIEFFNIFDIYKSGEMDERMFYKMVSTICRDKERITRARSGHIFAKIDLDNSGRIDKEEWLGWIFSTFSNYCGTVRRRLAQSDPQKLQRYYRIVDKDGSGSIDKDEFYDFVTGFSPESEFTRETADQLFDYIDTDRSGGIEFQEFFDWVHPRQAMERKAREAEAKAERRRLRAEAQGLTPSEIKFKTDLKGKSSALFEMPPNTPLTLEFTVGLRFENTLYEVEQLLRNNFDESVLQINVKIDQSTQGCRKIVALVGRGVVLWDRMRMMQIMEDPFTSITDARRWITSVLMETLPDLMRKTSRNKRNAASRGKLNGAALQPVESRAGSKGSFSLPGSKEATASPLGSQPQRQGFQRPILSTSVSNPQLARPQSQSSQRPVRLQSLGSQQAAESQPKTQSNAKGQRRNTSMTHFIGEAESVWGAARTTDTWVKARKTSWQ